MTSILILYYELIFSCNLSRSKSVEEGRDWIVWSQEVTEIQLTKGENGLGFSILDYQV